MGGGESLVEIGEARRELVDAIDDLLDDVDERRAIRGELVEPVLEPSEVGAHVTQRKLGLTVGTIENDVKLAILPPQESRGSGREERHREREDDDATRAALRPIARRVG